MAVEGNYITLHRISICEAKLKISKPTHQPITASYITDTIKNIALNSSDYFLLVISTNSVSGRLFATVLGITKLYLDNNSVALIRMYRISCN